MLLFMLVFALLTGAANAQVPNSPQTCRSVEATLRVTPTSFRRGTQPTFSVILKNVSDKPIRLLDVRNGRRSDLAHSYYEIVFEQNDLTVNNLPRAISDPGPVASADFFVLSPGAIAEALLSTPADLSALPVGEYSAHVRITLDPFGDAIPSCLSARTPFRVLR